MFISRKHYDDQRQERQKAIAEADALRAMNVQLNTHMDWMRIRLTQLEFERAAMLKRYLNIEVAVPQFEAPQEVPDLNQAGMDFNDVGDAAAATLGIGWNADGTLNYTPKS